MIEIKKTPAEAPAERDAARRKAQELFSVHDQRTALVKELVAQENAASDRKTAKLRALRLAREEANKTAAEQAGLSAAPHKSVKKRPRKIIRY